MQRSVTFRKAVLNLVRTARTRSVNFTSRENVPRECVIRDPRFGINIWSSIPPLASRIPASRIPHPVFHLAVARNADRLFSPMKRTPEQVANAIEGFVNGTGNQWDWDGFTSIRIDDPELGESPATLHRHPGRISAREGDRLLQPRWHGRNAQAGRKACGRTPDVPENHLLEPLPRLSERLEGGGDRSRPMPI